MLKIILIETPFPRNFVFSQTEIHLTGCTHRFKESHSIEKKGLLSISYLFMGWVHRIQYIPAPLPAPLLIELREPVCLNIEKGWLKYSTSPRNQSTLQYPTYQQGLRTVCQQHYRVFDLWCLLHSLSCCPGKYFLHKV